MHVGGKLGFLPEPAGVFPDATLSVTILGPRVDHGLVVAPQRQLDSFLPARTQT